MKSFFASWCCCLPLGLPTASSLFDHPALANKPTELARPTTADCPFAPASPSGDAPVWPVGVADRFDAIVSRTEAAMRQPSTPQARALLAPLRQEVLALKPFCSAYANSLMAMQLDLIDEYDTRHRDLHDADPAEPAALPPVVLGQSPNQIQAWHAERHDAACRAVVPFLHKSSAQRDEERALGLAPAARRQRYAWSFGSDHGFVDTDGRIGAPYAKEKFVGLSLVDSLPAWRDTLFLLQGEGPHAGPAAEAYAQAGIHFAQRVGSQRALFVNVATDKVMFFDDVARVAQKERFEADTLNVDWPDGARIEPAKILAIAESVLDRLRPSDQRTVLIVNCYGGLDRSGVTLAATQLLWAKRNGRYAGTDKNAAQQLVRADLRQMVENMKAVRPRAITTPARAVMLFEAGQLLCDGLPHSLGATN